jgi:hypothetical protein
MSGARMARGGGDALHVGAAPGELANGPGERLAAWATLLLCTAALVLGLTLCILACLG